MFSKLHMLYLYIRRVQFGRSGYELKNALKGASHLSHVCLTMPKCFASRNLRINVTEIILNTL
jgi:hypothetical protein